MGAKCHSGQSRLDFLDAAHGHTIAQRYRGFKSRHSASDSGTASKLTEAGHDGSVSVVRDPNSTIRVRGMTGASEVSLHPSSLKENPVQAWFDETGRFIMLEYTGQRAQVWDPATGLPVTTVFQRRYATRQEEYRTVKLPSLPK